ncbi:hypothetical protein [Streptomyces sp. AC555_RSS877]|uniref:hypothetical protein n=1 Tax=Streptomyces sp. AC555_RSS877 TaxID=2823688 RepID=UPI001C26AEA5|nr:hypothetical protein [Streptomyces sp. AC555_RSS877]
MADEQTKAAWNPEDHAGHGSPCERSPDGSCAEPKPEPIVEAYRTIAEHERQQDEACRAEIEQVLAKYGRKLVVTQPQITIVPT